MKKLIYVTTDLIRPLRTPSFYGLVFYDFLRLMLHLSRTDEILQRFVL